MIPEKVTLDHIVKDLLSFFNGFECLHEAKGEIEKQCDIKNEPEHECWSEDYIKQAWEEMTNKEKDKKSSRRKHWARVIMLQIVKRFFCNTCKQNAAQKNRHSTNDEQDCEMRRNPEGGSSQSKAELKTVGATGGDEQRIKKSEVTKLLDDSATASGSQHSVSSTDESPLPAEVNSSYSETKNAELVNENEKTLVKNYELPVEDVHDEENERSKNRFCLTVNKAAVKAAGGVKQQTTKRNQGQTGSVSSPEEVEADLENVSCKAKDDLRLTNDSKNTCGAEPSMTGNTRDRSTQSGAKLKKKTTKVKNPATMTVYIKIPFSEMFGSSSSTRVDQNITSHYKLIDRVPSYEKTASSEIRKRKSYIMSYNNETKNADWVYEILNKSILKQKCKEQMTFGTNELKNKDCNQGHLAAAANHMWCQEAYHDAFLMSNMTPQNKRLNEGVWSLLEQHCRDLVKDESVCNVHVYTGLLYPDKKQKKNKREEPLKKAVPTHFFKVVIVEKEDGTVEEPECYVMPNEKPKELLNKFKVSINTFGQEYPFTFIERDKKFDRLLKKTVKLTGEDGNGELHSVDINVILAPPRS